MSIMGFQLHMVTQEITSGHLLQKKNTKFCPCHSNIQITTPPFINDDYFCELGISTTNDDVGFIDDNPLWDGQGCISTL